LGGAITTDGFRAYPPLSGIGFRHLPKVYDPKGESEHLKWIHIIIGNAKAFILGTYHGLAEKHMDFYPAEFCFRFDRRFKPKQLFNRLANACVKGTKIPYAELVM
jgi:hypothetical protein